MADRHEQRPSWDEYFMKLANEVATRTTCLRRTVGAVIVKDKRILATGYNGAPSGLRHCAETGCLRQQLGIPSGQRSEICRGLHAEQNAIVQAARYGIDIAGASIYVNTQPCVICAKMIINAGITEVIYQNPYPDELAMDMLAEAGIKMRVFQEGGAGEESRGERCC
ncbi:deoxycytidylate deaminase [Xiamenia xianingshaonis]|uniref:Cytidine deaminase n=1 Tax=Xiamenia xianingshaonis TaxID=2682776 RepID=A0A9E6MR62_9ACTN|nr:cytidine/deoxycytidylate deaminase family protein [Xiamenia xianingshaonis]NGM17587.1 cytidine deaminase [Eggerthellaceae bacterium zg-893]NHM13253.1 cytidine deaminase [Xiamenia xianingshaonis]NHM15374.1 cytidine deaminase [Xiamenia xianingshaonis]QTU84660.1 cytidine/deoxycytidylate deaminase family protein [Xiamenia xianingshaonis]